MRNHLISFRLISAIFLALVTQKAHSDCDFNTSNYIQELNDPASIISINVDIPDNKKWTKNLLKITLDRSSNINPKFRDKFRSKVTVFYQFGTCSYEAKVRISGDQMTMLNSIMEILNQV